MLSRKILFLAIITLSINLNAQNIYYAKTNGIGTGTSWATATNNLDSLIHFVPNNSQIWVAFGTYYPTSDQNGNSNPTNVRLKSFSLRSGVKIYGGFTGINETSLSQRNWTMNPTILSGDIGVQNDSTDNSYHVFYHSGVDTSSVLDGFVIEKGNANSTYSLQGFGGGMYNTSSSPQIANCTFRNNSALASGGIHNNSINLKIINCTFVDNYSTQLYSGALTNYGGSAKVVKTNFTNNKALNSNGGAIYSYNAKVVIDSCTFFNNYGFNVGGAINHYSVDTLKVSNSNFTNNKTNESGGAINTDGITLINHSDFENNKAKNGAGAINISNNNIISIIKFCNLINNSGDSTDVGGALIISKNDTVSNCTFEGNLAYNGGAIFSSSDDETTFLANCLFKNNTSIYRGGAVYLTFSKPKFINNTFYGNIALNNGGGIYINNLSSQKPIIYNSIFWNNSNSIVGTNSSSTALVYNSIVQGGYNGINTLNIDPLFNNAPINLSLSPCSPGIDYGVDSVNHIQHDLLGNLRKFDAVTGDNLIDVGAYELQSTLENQYIGPNTNNLWNNNLNWSKNVKPSPCDHVVIPINKNVILNENSIIRSLLILANSNLNIEPNHTLHVKK